MSSLITLSILAILVLYLGLYKAKNALLPATLLGLAGALVLAVLEWNGGAQPIYSGMMLFDNFAIAFTTICIFSTMLILLISKDYFESISEHVAEYYTLILFSLAGILVMVSYHNLTMLFIGVEIMSVSLYILAGIRKDDFKSNEAALKYFLMGAFSTGFLLFGITLLYGATGTFDLTQIRDYVIANPTGISPLFYTGITLLIIGLCFKVGAAPFHFWTPDVYEGSPTLITAFMSTVVKTAGFAAFLRLFLMCFAPLHDFWMPALLVISLLTLFVGNVTALYQHSFKRMLAFSSISHVGYMLFAIVALGVNSSNSVFIYATAYSIASIVAFAVLILVKRQTGADNFDSFNGLAKKNPFIAFTLTVAMLSLAGIPLTAGFIGKFMMFSTALAEYHIWLVILAVLNAVIGIFYYLRVIVAMYFKGAERNEIQSSSYFNFVLGFSALITVVIGVYPGFISSLF
ncbi:NADH-quinone oxidoreductase subunit N [Daejeonella lutea]|uniref:NADH-quinone oxidoreductase subunit N n=1 Tax=Daejeonella lutea TaxID=572036 RepID=A0A1T5D745_9SPHI|nr:NADH-quinone oxidoreductase subunit N [Daejeonella lutea]SKB67505.1 NADH-quinone oxidoreductase subunit N [Daejeonella lutea]